MVASILDRPHKNENNMSDIYFPGKLEKFKGEKALYVRWIVMVFTGAI